MLEIDVKNDPQNPVMFSATVGASFMKDVTFPNLTRDLVIPGSLLPWLTLSNPMATAGGKLDLSASFDGTSTSLLGAGSLATLTVSLATPNDLSSITFTPAPDTSGLTDALEQLSPAFPEEILKIALQAVSSLQGQPFLNEKFELLGNHSLNDVLGLANKLVAVFNQAVPALSTSELTFDLNAVQSAIVVLDVPPGDQMADTETLESAVGVLQGVLSGTVNPTRLISAARQLEIDFTQFISEFVIPADGIPTAPTQVLSATDPLLTTLQTELTNLENLVPSVNSLLAHAQSAIQALFPNDSGVAFHLAWVPNYDSNPNDAALIADLSLTETDQTMSVTPTVTASNYGQSGFSGVPAST